MTSCTERGPRWPLAVAAVLLALTSVVAAGGANGSPTTAPRSEAAATGSAQPKPSTSELPAAEAVEAGQVLVSLTFDDGFADQRNAVPLLAKHKLRATFYIIDGNVRYPGYLSWRQIWAIARAGHEIGGHTSSHPRLTEVPAAQQRREICDSRATLLEAGFEVTSFAYPYGDTSPAVAKVVDSCGFNTARDVSGLVNGDSCGGCPVGNPVPLPEPFRVRANSATSTLPLLKSYVRQAVDEAAATGAGSYVPLVFHHVCDPCSGANDEEITPRDLDTFLGWLKAQPAVTVRTVHDVAGGQVRPPVGAPVLATVKRALAQRPPPAASGSEEGSWQLLGLELPMRLLVVGGGLVVLACLAVVLIGSRRRGDRT